LSSAKYPEALWNAAEQFRRGHDYEQSLLLINQYLATEPDRLMAAALVQRSRIELDLDRIPEALADLQQVVRKHPTDPAMFTALYLIGVCHFEQNELDQAEAVWRGILLSDQLLPSAVEWRDAQLSLGRLLFEKGELERRVILVRSSPPETADTDDVFRKASAHWQEAARLLGRYLDRNANGTGAREARSYLGKSFQREAEWLGRQWDKAETDNARQQLEIQQDAMLDKALKQFKLLRDELQDGQTKDQINEVEQRLLKNCCFEIPHTQYQLREYGEAITAYNTAVSRYPHDVQTLVAFLQMARCYEDMTPPKPVEARSMLQQAKVILSHKQIPESAFQSPATNLSRAEWQAWLERASLVR
jgi:tetratricopeptide (TPR) repeat protein